MVFVVVVDLGETAVSVALIERDSDRIVRPDFQAHVGTVVRQGTLFSLVQQLFPQAHASTVGGNGYGVESGQGGAAMKQHQAVPHQLTARLRDDQAGVGAADHPLKTAWRQSVRGKTLVFQRQQGLQVFLRSVAK